MTQIQDILNNTNTQFTVNDDHTANPNYASLYALDFAGRVAVSAYESDIARLSAKYGVDANLVKSIMYVENAQGNYGGIGYLSDLLGVSSTIMPMNINPNIWGGLVGSGANFNNAATNIEAGVILISRIQEHLAPQDRTIAKIATLYNDTQEDTVTDYGARVAQVYSTLSFESSITPDFTKYISTRNALDQLKFVKEGEYAFINNDSGGGYLFKIVNGVPTVVDPNCNLDVNNPNLEIVKSLPTGSKVTFIGSGDIQNSQSVSDTSKYQVSSGDTLSEIAQDHGISLNYLLSLNPSITNPNQIQSGQIINVPLSSKNYSMESPSAIATMAEILGTDVATITNNNPWIQSLSGSWILDTSKKISLPASSITNSIKLEDVTLKNSTGAEVGTYTNFFLDKANQTLLTNTELNSKWQVNSNPNSVLNNATIEFDFDSLAQSVLGTGNKNWDGVSAIDNSLLNLEINTNLTSGFAGGNDLGQTGNVIGDADWRATMPINVINGDGYKNVASSGIVSDGFRPGNQELSSYANFNTQLNVDFSRLDNLANQLNQANQNQSIPDVSKLNFQLQNPLAEITNNAINARTFLNIDPVVLDLNGDGALLRFAIC